MNYLKKYKTKYYLCILERPKNILSPMNIVHVLIEVCSFWTFSPLRNVLSTLFSNFGLGVLFHFSPKLDKSEWSLLFVNACQCFANACQCLPMLANACQCLPMLANDCKCFSMLGQCLSMLINIFLTYSILLDDFWWTWN